MRKLGLNICSKRMYYFSLEVLSAHCSISFALLKHIHIILAIVDFVWVLLKAINEIHVEALAWILLLLSILLLLWSLSITLSWGLFLLLSWSLATMTASTTHHTSDSLMSNFRTGSESHSLHKGSTQTRHHTSSRLLWWMSSWCWCWPWCWSWWSCSRSSWSSIEETTTATSTGSSSRAWSSSSASWHFYLINYN